MNNNFNIFSVAGKIIQNALFTGNSAAPKQNVPAEPFLPTPEGPKFQPSQLLENLFATIQKQDMELNQTSAYMKDILNLPQEFKDLVIQLKNLNQNTNQKDMINLLLVNNLLGDNPKEAIQKIIQQMADMARKNIDTTQMKELMTIILNNVSSGSQMDFVKNVLLMYIPFLPITQKSEIIDWEIKEKSEEQNKEEKEEAIEILIGTINYQNIKILMYCEGLSHIDIIIYCADNFPKRILTEFIKMFARENNFTVQIGYENLTSSSQNTKQNIKIMSGIIINSCVMLLLQSIINFVLNMDLNEGKE